MAEKPTAENERPPESFERPADACTEAVDASSPPPFDPQTYSFRDKLNEPDIPTTVRIVVDRQLRMMTWLALLLAAATAAMAVFVTFYFMMVR